MSLQRNSAKPRDEAADSKDEPEKDDAGAVLAFTKAFLGVAFCTNVRASSMETQLFSSETLQRIDEANISPRNKKRGLKQMCAAEKNAEIQGLLNFVVKQEDSEDSLGDEGDEDSSEKRTSEHWSDDKKHVWRQDKATQRESLRHREMTDECARQWSMLPIFADIDPEVVAALCKATTVMEVKADVQVAGDGDSQGVASLLYVFEGEVDVFARGKFVRNVTAGSYAGETRLLGIQSAKALAIASTEPSVIFELTRKAFLNVLSRHPTVKQHFEDIREQHRCDITKGVLTHTCPLLSGISMRALIEIDMLAVERLYFPGERIIQQGATGNDFYMLVEGRASVVNSGGECLRQLVGNGSDAACFGERTFLGIEKCHSASVIANTVCLSRNLQRSDIAHLLSQHQEAIHLSQVQEIINQTEGSDTVTSTYGSSEKNGILHALEIGQGLLDWIESNCKQRLFLDKQMLIDPSLPCDNCLFVITKGTAEVEGSAVRDTSSDRIVLRSGAFVGEHVPLGFKSKRTAAIVAVGTVCAWVIYDYTLHQGLRLYPDEKEKVLLLTFANAPAPALRKSDPEQQRTYKRRLSILERTRNTAMKSMIDTVQNAMWASPLFSGVSAQFVQLMAAIAQSHIYLPGDDIAVQGDPGDSMFIMISGEANVFFRDAHNEIKKIGTLSAGSICGELTMLAISPARTATITAATMSTFWEVTQAQATSLLDELPDDMEMFANIVIRNLEHSVLHCIQTVPTFTAFESKFKTLIYMCCDRRAYWGGSRMAEQGEPGEGLFIINRGLAILSADGSTIKQASEGHYFGVAIMQGLHKICPCSLIALNLCHVLVVTRDNYLLALDRYPSEQAHKELRAAERIAAKDLAAEIEERLKKKRLVRKSMIQYKEGSPVDLSWIRKILRHWRHHARHSHADRNMWRKMRNQDERLMNQMAVRIAAGHDKRKTVELQKELLHSRTSDEAQPPEEEKTKASPRARAQSQGQPKLFNKRASLELEDPYKHIDAFMMEDIHRPRYKLVHGARCRAASEKHMQRITVAVKIPSPAEPSPRLTPRHFRPECRIAAQEIFWLENDSRRLPAILADLVPKSTVNAFVLRPVLRALTIDSVR